MELFREDENNSCLLQLYRVRWTVRFYFLSYLILLCLSGISFISNTKSYAVLYWEIQTRIHWYRPSLRSLRKLSEWLYYPVQNKEMFSVWFINFLFFQCSSCFSFSKAAQALQCDVMPWQSDAIAKWKPYKVKPLQSDFIFSYLHSFLFESRENSNNLVSLW